MAEAVSSVEKFRQLFYDCLKEEDIDEVHARSKKVTINLYRRKKSMEDPWEYCFYFDYNEPNEFFLKYSTWFSGNKNITNDQITHLISNCDSITDEEMNRCKAALRREIRSRNLPDLSSQPERLQKLFSEERSKFYENLEKQKILAEQINQNMTNFNVSLKDGLEALKPLSKITVTSDTTLDVVTTNITKMRCMMQDFWTHADSAIANIFEAMEKCGRYQDVDEKIDRDVFSFLAHFFPNFLIPRAVSARHNLSE